MVGENRRLGEVFLGGVTGTAESERSIAEGMNGMKRVHERLLRAGLVLLGMITGNGLALPTALAAEFHFVIQDVGGDAAAWSPREVVIYRRVLLDEKLVFVLENPTPRTHVFEAPDLFEQILEGTEGSTPKALRVYVTSGETVHVQVSTEPLKRHSAGGAAGPESYQFFCPLHGPEEELRSTIRVVP